MALPSRIDVYEDKMVIAWDDSHESTYGNKFLRGSCQCATCIEEWTRRPLLRLETIPEDIQATAVDHVGRYALRIGWSDGHHTGIYTYDFLRQLCPCPICKAQQSAQPGRGR